MNDADVAAGSVQSGRRDIQGAEVAHAVVRNPKADSNLAEGDALLEYPCWAAPVLSHGLLHVRGKDRIVCMELIPEKR